MTRWLPRATLGLLMGAMVLACGPAAAQNLSFDSGWYDGAQPYVKIAVAHDGVYAITGSELRAAGVPVGSIDPATLRLLENGREIPIHVETGGSGSMERILFVGRRNRGAGELWAYENLDPALQSSTFYSLYTDTTTYWLTWDGTGGLRYEAVDGAPIGAPQAVVRDTLHREEDRRYHYGDAFEVGRPLFTRGEGYYWQVFGEGQSRTYTLILNHLAASTGDEVHLRVRFNSRTPARHRAILEIERNGAFQRVDVADWNGYASRTLQASFSTSDLPADGTLRLRLTFAATDGDTPNSALLDWIEVDYPRLLEAKQDAQHFAVAGSGPHTFELTDYQGSPVYIFNTTDARLFVREANGGTVQFSDDPSARATFWAVASTAFRTPASLSYQPPGSHPDWTSTAHRADYVILTTHALAASAQALADYRRAHNDFDVAVAYVQDVFDQFDYGRPTPLAVRRFVHHTQTWATAPRFLAIWGDATYPVRGATDQPDAPWNVPTFGYAPSDGWYAMQYDGDNRAAYNGPPEREWRPMLAVGRIPLRTNEQGQTFLQKLRTYESAPLRDWQKRMLLLSGGANPTQQNRLNAYSREWAEIAASPPTGADTVYFAKKTDDALDTSFQDSLSAAFERGAVWVNYFGHSAAQTWAIVTEPPSQYDNAGRLPFVVSLGCQTGAYAGGRYTTKAAPSFGEQLLLGLSRDAGPTAPGTLDGAIAHFGTSYLGTIGPSATLNDALVDAAFRDTVRFMGRAVQAAKTQIAATHFRSRIYVNHLLQYSLLGDPAARLTLPTQPDLHLAPNQLSVAPLTPQPSDVLALTARITNRGLVPADTVAVTITHRMPNGRDTTVTRSLPPFPLERTVRFRTLLTAADVGVNRFHVDADPAHRLVEAVETNNVAEVEKAVFSSGLALLTPRPYGTVSSRRPTLRVNVTTASEQTQTIVFALDDEASFDTPLAGTDVMTQRLVAEWTPSTPLESGSTYFWRAALDVASTSRRSGAFTVRADLPAGSFLQQGALFEANTHGSHLTRRDGQWQFATYELEVTVYSEEGSGRSDYGFNVDGAQNYVYLGYGFRVMIMDGATGRVEASGSFCTYEISRDDRRQMHCKDGLDGEAAIDLLDAFIAEHLQQGDYLFLGTRFLLRPSDPTIPDEVEAIFAPYSDAIDSLTYEDLWILKARKGFPEETVERVNNSTNEIVYRTRLQFRHAAGQTTSPLIGPARRWDTLDFAAERTGADAIRVDVLTASGDSVLIGGVRAGDLPFSLATIDARRHPHLHLRATLIDSTARTAPQLERWSVSYTSPAEVTLDGRALQLTADTLAHGQTMQVVLPVANLDTETTADTIFVRYQVTDAQNRTRPVATDTIFALPPGGRAISRMRFGTLGLTGSNVLRVTAAQPGLLEALSSNNTLVKRFYIRGDDRAPNLRVLIDGRTLAPDFEPLKNLQAPGIPYVSARPTIEVVVDDENAFRPITDPALIKLYLDCDPDAPLVTCAPAADTTFRPAEASVQPARVTHTPDLSRRDTVHTLRVYVRDASGNLAGEGAAKPSYQVHFRVQSDLAVRDLYPYPNPMSRRTVFAFQLKGSDASKITEFRIRIYTLTGRLIREFDLLDNPMLLEAGGLRIGWNKVPWNGTDADGDRIATGIYLYKVFVESTDGSIEVNGGRVEKIAVIR